MYGHIIRLLLLSLIGIQLNGQETYSDQKNQQKSTDIAIPPVEESIQMLTGSSIDNLSASIDLRAQAPSDGNSTLKLYHSNGSSGILFSDNIDNDEGFYLHSDGDPSNFRLMHGCQYFNSNVNVFNTQLFNVQADGRIQFGDTESTGAFIDIRTPIYSDIPDILTIKKWTQGLALWSIKNDRLEQNLDHHLNGDLDITDGTVTVKDGNSITWNSTDLSFNIRVPFTLNGNLVQSNGTNTFFGDVNLNSASLNVSNETAHIDNEGWQLHLNNDNNGEDDTNNWYIGASHENWQIGDDRLVFSKGTNSGSDWVMYLSRSGEIVNINNSVDGGILMAVNGSTYSNDFWVQSPQMSAYHKSNQEGFSDQLKSFEVYTSKSGEKHAISSKLSKPTVTQSLDSSDKAYVNYTEIIAITVGALQEQINQNNMLEERIARLEKIIDNR